jgi:hypothetical protein
METIEQYKKEEKSLLKKRYLNDKYQIDALINVLKKDNISTDENVSTLKKELGKFHRSTAFDNCKSMGEIVETNIKVMLEL